MIALSPCPVLFVQDTHRYYRTDDGLQLNGVTSTLMRRLFPDMYAGVPAAVLDAAARRGSIVHEDIELAETLGTEPSTDEGRNYVALKQEHALQAVASEYLVSDLRHYASSIDLVFQGPEENSVLLADVKTTARFHNEAVGWQLSIYAYFFEKMNPAIKVTGIMGLWLRGADIASVITLPQRPADEVQALIEADLADRPYTWQPMVPAYVEGDATELAALSEQIHRLTEQRDRLRASVLASMQQHGDASIDLGSCTLSVVRGAERATFDAKTFRTEHADLYGRYLKTKQSEPTLRITLKGTDKAQQPD